MADLTVNAVVDTFMSQTTQGAMRATGLGIPIAAGNLAWTSWTLAGAYTCTMTLTNNTSVTFPTTGTLATLAGSETFTNKVLTAPTINAYTMTGTGTIAAGCTLTSPTLVTPTLGVATATSINGLTVTSSTGTLTITNGKTASFSNSVVIAGTDGTTITMPSSTSTLYGTATGSITSLQLKTSLSDETGSGAAVFATSPTLVTPVLGAATATTINGMGLATSIAQVAFTESDSNVLTFDGINASVTLTVPSASGTLATLAGVESLSNKTLVTPDIGVATGTSLTASGLIKTSGNSGIGYATGAGGTVTQLTDRTTGVTLNKISGQITTHNASLAAEASADFVVSTTACASTDVPVVAIQSGSNSGGTIVSVIGVANGSFTIRVHNGNVAAGTAETGSIVINFCILKSVAS